MDKAGEGDRSMWSKVKVICTDKEGEWSMVVKGTSHLLTSIIQPATFPLFFTVNLYCTTSNIPLIPDYSPPLRNQQHSLYF